MKIEVRGVWEPLEGAWGAFWSQIGAQERQEEPQEAILKPILVPRWAKLGAKLANSAPRWGRDGQLGRQDGQIDALLARFMGYFVDFSATLM